MRFKLKLSLLVVGSLAAVLAGMPARSQSLVHDPVRAPQQPSQQQIEGFCANWGQLSDSEKRQYRDQYERYCRDKPVFGQPAEPQEPQQQQQPRKPEKPEKPRKPATPEKPDEPEPPEPEIRPAKPEPAIPEPAPRRVDLVGELTLAGPLARAPGERQRLRVTVENRGPGGGPHAPGLNGLWARVFLSDRDVSRRGASARAFSFSGARQGWPVRLPGVPGPGGSREATTEITVPAGTPDDNYWWCVRLDTRQQVEETDEGNNAACARKVVALGGESDSELSDMFGSKVATLDERQREGKQSASQPSHPGLLRQSELDRIAAMLMQTDGSDYTVLTGQAGGNLTEAHNRGLLLMRDRGELIPLGGDYYKDGRGNMVIFGELPGSGDGAVPYALTLFSGGGLQLAVDTDRDGLIDVGVSEGLKERFGFLARPGMEHILDCMKRMVQGGTGAAESLPECLAGGSSNDGGGDSGEGGPRGPGADLESALEPSCDDASQNGTSVGFTEEGSGADDDLKDVPDDHLEKTRNWAVGTVDWHREFADEAREAGDRELANAHDAAADRARAMAAAAQRALDTERGSSEREDAVRELNKAYDAYTEAQDYVRAVEESREDSEGHSGKEMPGPGPGGVTRPGTSDPRCQEPSVWNRLHSERCASNTMDCLKRMSDPIYAATGGQCETARGPDDAERVKCEGNDSFGECLEGSDDVQGCAEKHAGSDNGGVTPSPDDDIFREDDQGNLGYGVMDVHPFGATLAAMCRGSGGIGPCGDPSPSMDAAR